jgi:hypothetical protein
MKILLTGANGYMFTLLNKLGEIGVRFSEEVKKKYIEEFNTTIYSLQAQMDI